MVFKRSFTILAISSRCCYVAPKGTSHVSAMLNATAIDLVEGGKDEIFTPSYFFLARKK